MSCSAPGCGTTQRSQPSTSSTAPAPPSPRHQAALTEGLRTSPQLHAAAERIVAGATEALFGVDLTEEAALQCLKQAVPGIQG